MNLPCLVALFFNNKQTSIYHTNNSFITCLAQHYCASRTINFGLHYISNSSKVTARLEVDHIIWFDQAWLVETREAFFFFFGCIHYTDSWKLYQDKRVKLMIRFHYSLCSPSARASKVKIRRRRKIAAGVN